MYLTKIECHKDYRNFKAGEVIEIDTNFLLLVGMNGCGKSTILDALRDDFKITDSSLFKKPAPKGTFTITKTENVKGKYYDFHSDDKKFSHSFGDDMMGQIAAMNNSSGIGSLLQFNNTNIKNVHDSVILLDEPDRGMAPKIQRTFSDMFLKMVHLNNNQLIITSHSTYLMDAAELFGKIYSIEHKRYFDTKDEFLEAHLK